jgi:hypothetical protein|nr:hypothetical protein [uncultured Flavobacterium sp.]
MKNRQEILQMALLLENFSSIFLAKLVGIEDWQNTRSLGNKSGNLSFNQKIELLIDIGALSKIEKSKFQTFMELRNQFMHNLKADTYEACYSFLDGKENFVLKLFPQDPNLIREEKLRRASLDLGNDILGVTTGLLEAVKKKNEKEVKVKVLEKSQKSAFIAIKAIEDTLNHFIDERIEQNKLILPNELKDLGSEIRKLIYQIWAHKFKTHDDNDGIP